MLKRRDHASGRREPRRVSGIASKSVSESLLKVYRKSHRKVCRESSSIAAIPPRFAAIRRDPAAFRRKRAHFQVKWSNTSNFQMKWNNTSNFRGKRPIPQIWRKIHQICRGNPLGPQTCWKCGKCRGAESEFLGR